jgi:FkbM family methyltransferase
VIEQYVRQVKAFSTLNPVVCLEIGALDGLYSRDLKDAFGLKEENLYLVEPNRALHAALAQSFPDAKLIKHAIAGSKGTRKFNRVVSTEKARIGSSSLTDRVDIWRQYLDYESVSVDTVPGSELLEFVGKPVDLCIVDVEGAAFEVVTSFGDRLANIRSVMIECEHAPLFDGQRHFYDDVAAVLVANGFRLMAFQYSYAQQSDSIWIREEYVEFLKSFKDER